MTRWLFIQRDYGQLGNRLHTHANALAWCIENQVNLINLSFKRYSPWFSSDKGRSVETFITRKSKLSNLLRYERLWELVERVCRSDKWVHRLTKMVILEKNDDELLAEPELDQSFKLGSQSMLVRAWDLQFPKSLKKNEDRVREILTPNKQAKDSADKIISQLREKFDCIVGIHARRGDYKEYLGGVHFHSWDSYRNWIIQTKDLMKVNGKGEVGFLLCSDEKPNTSEFNNLPVSFGSEKSVMSDLHSLSLCDFNVGPPSSFGTWLSWHGKVPRLTLQKDMKIHSIDQFVISSQC